MSDDAPTEQQEQQQGGKWYCKLPQAVCFNPKKFGDDGTMRECIAEMMGTFILCVFGIGACAQHLFSGSHDPWLVYFGWGLGCTFGIYWAAGVSGGHINPAVTLGMCVTGRTPWKKFLPYTFFQTCGAFWASVMVYMIYWDQLNHYTGNDRMTTGGKATAGIFTTFPPEHVSNFVACIDQMAVTAFFVGTIHALTDERNAAPGSNLAPLLIGLLVATCGACFGTNAGFGINPARDMGPRMFLSTVGYGMKPWSVHDYWGVMVCFAQMFGGFIGGIMYDLNVSFHQDDEDEDDKEKSE